MARPEHCAATVLMLRLFVTLLLGLPISAAVQSATPADPIPLHIKQALLSRQTSTAVPWLKQAAAAGHREAAFTLAQLYQLGELVELDRARAIELYRQAAQYGHRDAERYIAELKGKTPQVPSSAFALIQSSQPPQSAHLAVDWQTPDKNGVTPLLYAAQNKRWSWVSTLTTSLPHGSVNRSGPLGNRALHYAAADNALDATRHLIAAGADVNACDHEGVSPLHRAISNKAIAVARLLVDAGADHTLQDRNGWSARMLAERLALKDLHFPDQQRFDAPGPAATNQQMQEAFMRAIKSGNQDAVLHFLAAGASPNRAIDGVSALSIAIAHSPPATVSVLLDAGADPEGTSLPTPLMQSVNLGRADIASILLQTNADPTVMDGRGRTALHHAALVGTTSCITLLIQHGARLNQKDNQGATPLILAVKNKNTDAANALLAHDDLDIDARDLHGRTALWWAVSVKHQDSIDLLITHDAGWLPDEHGHTPAHLALTLADAGLYQRFFDQQTLQEINALNIDGNSVLHLAARHNNGYAISQLIAKGVDMDQQNARGDTALHVAARNAALDAATMLVAAGASLQRRNHQLISAHTLLQQNPGREWQALQQQARSDLATLWSRMTGN